VRAGGSRERLPPPLQPIEIHFVSYQCNTINQTASWDVSGSRLLDNSQKCEGCLHDQLRLRTTFKSGSPPGSPTAIGLASEAALHDRTPKRYTRLGKNCVT